METPEHYDNICEQAKEVQKDLKLTDTQTLLYNHICRGDFKLRNDDGQKFYDPNNNGFGWSGNREWVKQQFKPLIKACLVNFISLRDCVGGRYTSWYFWDKGYNLDDLVDAGCYVSTYKLALIKYYLNLPDGFDKRNGIYKDIEFNYDENEYLKYSFKYKQKESIYFWDIDGKGIKKSTYNKVIRYESFQRMISDIYSFLINDGFKNLREISGYHTNRLS